MMSDHINTVRPGEKLKADTVNKLIKRVGMMDAPNVSATASTLRMSPGTNDNLIRVKNTTGESLYRMNIVGIEAITSEPTPGEEVSFMDGVVFVASKPNLEKPCALIVENIRKDAIGLAMIYGVYQARVSMDDEEHKYATVQDDNCTTLISAATGPFSIVWRAEAKDGVSHCFVQFPSASNVVEGQGGNFRQHSHSDGSWQQGGFANAVYSSGSSVPQLPWQ